MEIRGSESNDELLDYLYKLSGAESRHLSGDDFKLVCESLWSDSPEIRERAIFIGGLRCFDRTVICALRSMLLDGVEGDEENRRLMIEAIVSFHIERSEQVDLTPLLDRLIGSNHPESLTAKAAYVGMMRINGELDKKGFASLDYDDVVVPNEN